MVNSSPDPFSNVAVSTVEDITTGGLLYLVFAYPLVAGIIAVLLLGVALGLLLAARRLIRQFFGHDNAPGA